MSTPTRLGAPAALLLTRIAVTNQAMRTASQIRSPSSHSLFSTSSTSLSAPVPPRMVPKIQAETGVPLPRNLVELVDRYPQHPLMQFFHMRERTTPEIGAKFNKEGEPGATRVVMIPVTIDDRDFNDETRRLLRAWTAPELRRKSSLELHQLWYVLVKEHNVFLTKMEELKRSGTKKLLGSNEPMRHHMHMIRLGMARVKFVLNERRLTLLAMHNDHKSKLGQQREDVAELVAEAASISEDAAELEVGEDAAATAQKEVEFSKKLADMDKRLKLGLEAAKLRRQKEEEEILEAAMRRNRQMREKGAAE